MLKNVSHPLIQSTTESDVLDDVLDTLRFRGSIFFHSSLAAPWGMSLVSSATPRFHVALEGGFCVGTSDSHVSAKAMDIVMLPKGDMHWIADRENRKLVASEDAGKACELGQPLFQQGEITNRLMCGVVEYEHAISHPITSALPSIFHLANIHREDSIWMTVQQIDREINRSGNKKSTIIDRLTEVLFIQLLHQYMSENDHLTGFLAALREPRIGKTLELLHKNPQVHWTLDMISEKVGMSRATLQRKFKSELDISPITYLNRWRIAKAYQLVKYSSQSLDGVADSIGFSDARTLRIAFQRQYGITPSELRGRASGAT
ncbi:MAG: AraC-like DNA-binding protein [Halieaceae bacterium]|jgi:AraC-like DNA-binding protein